MAPSQLSAYSIPNLKWSAGTNRQERVRSNNGYQTENKTDALLPFLIIERKKCIRFSSKNIQNKH